MRKESRLEKIQKRYDLANTPECKALMDEFLSYIVKAASGSTSPEKIQGMLMLVGLPDSWIVAFEAEKDKLREE